MKVSFRALTQKDELFLGRILKESFNSDSELAFGEGVKLGPPGYDDGTLAKKIIGNDQLTQLIIRADNQACGVLIVTEGKTNEVNYFCLDPSFIGKNIGTMAWKTFEATKEGTWLLETPAFSVRNHRFYRKNGFSQIGEKLYSEDSKSFIFSKEL